MLRRRFVLLAPVVAAGCRPRRDLSQYTIEDYKANLLSAVDLGNPDHGAQLKAGFHQIEEKAWRWTEPQFKVELKAPFAGQKAGATLILKGVIPEIVVLRTGPVTIGAKLNGKDLGQATYAKAGEIEFRQDVAAALLRADDLMVEFTVSPGLQPNTFPGDGRALGLIVSRIELEKKTI